MKDPDRFSQLASLGDSSPLKKEENVAAIRFVCSLYGDNKCANLNELRCKMADKGVSARKLPPAEDSFSLHLERCVYQVYIWKQSPIPSPELPAPTLYGYEKDEDGLLTPKIMTQEPAAPELLNNILCDCTSDACLSNCSCFLHNQSCSTACPCKAALPDLGLETICKNSFTTDAYSTRDDTDSE